MPIRTLRIPIQFVTVSIDGSTVGSRAPVISVQLAKPNWTNDLSTFSPPIWTLVDTGAGTTTVDLDLAKSLGHSEFSTREMRTVSLSTPVFAFNSALAFPDISLTQQAQLIAVEGLAAGAPYHAIIGRNFLENCAIHLDWQSENNWLDYRVRATSSA